MPLIRWSDDLSVRVKELDGQHQRLIGMINDLHDAMRIGKGREAIGKTLNELANYAVTHFSTEEKYFKKYDFPETASHVDSHAGFIKEVAAFKKEFDAGQIGLTIKVMNFLSDWLTGHIKGEDKKYGPFFNEKGLT